MKTTHYFVQLCMLMILLSCSSTDDSTETQQKESFRVSAVGMLATQFPASEGDELEVYGTIAVRLIYTDDTVEERILWQRNRDRWEAVGPAETSINSEGSAQVLTLSEDEVRDGTLIEVYANIYDRDPDGNPDDFLGQTSIANRAGIYTIVPDRDQPVPVQLTLNEFEGITLLVRFTIEHIRD
jgi:hypothetical protein